MSSSRLAILLALALSAAGSVTASAQRQLTTRKRLHAVTAVDRDDALSVDTVINPEGFALSGYDKPLRSSRETIFVTNGSDTDVTGLEIEITYHDMDGRQLHQRVVRIDTDLPRAATRKLDFKSWDEQQSFYYANGTQRPRRRAFPYTVTARVTAVHIIRP